ncbi:unnamed protein product, partial [Rotaria sordida]
IGQSDELTLSQTLRDVLTTVDQEQVQTSMISNKRQQSSSELCTTSNTKKIKMTTTDTDDTAMNMKLKLVTNSIPSYLLKTNKLFIQMSKSITNLTKSISIDDIHDIAMLLYKKAALHINRDITKAYFHSVQGTLKEPELEANQVNRSVWPIEAQSFMLAKMESMKTKNKPTTTSTTTPTTKTTTTTTTTAKTTTATTTTTKTTALDINDEKLRSICSDLLSDYVQEMKEQMSDYEEQLDEKKNSLVDLTIQMEDIIKNYVQQYCIKPLEMKRKLKIALLCYDFDTEILKRQYMQEKPNDYQLKVAQTLYNAKRELERSKRNLLELKEQVFYNKSLSIFDTLQTSMLTKNNEDVQRSIYQYEKDIQQKKIDIMIIEIIEAESKFYQDQQTFDVHMSTMWKNHRGLVQNQGMTTILTNIIDKTLSKIADRWRSLYKYRVDYYLRNSYDDDDDDDTHDKSSNDNDKHMKKFGFSSFVIMDTNNKFTDKQIELLNRGPSYVPPFQLSISTTIKTMDDRIKKQYAPLKHQLTNLFGNSRINIALSMEITKQIFQEYKENFSITIPTKYKERANYERKIIQSIRYLLSKNNLILRRTADNGNTFYIGNRSNFEKKANDYLLQTDSYKLLSLIDDIQQWQNNFREMIDSMNYLLQQLKQHKAIQNDLYERLVIDFSKIQLTYLYFLPDISKENEITLVPYILTHQSATIKIGKFLQQVLRPFVDKILKSSTFRDDIDFIQKFTNYIEKERRLQTKTIFCTIEITNYSTLDIHTNMIDIIGYFLHDNLATNKLEQISIQTIKNLLYIFLNNNICCYKNKVYKIMKGCPTTIPLSETLSNIYTFQWQKMISTHSRKHMEFFGRHKNQIFFTWYHGTESELCDFLQTIKEKFPNVQFQKFIGYNAVFLNTFIENQQGQLYSRINYHPILPQFRLPYLVGHPKLGHSDWLRWSLIRAVCCCSLIEDFRRERIYLELSYLTNGYSLLFVETHIQNFFEYFHTSHLRFTKNQTEYNTFRQQWFDYIDIQYELTDQLQQFDDQGRLIRLHHLYEYGSVSEFNNKFLRLWSEYFHHHPIFSKERLCNVNQSSTAPSTVPTTPDPLNMAYINESDTINQKHYQNEKFQEPSSTIIHDLISTITEEKREIMIGSHSPPKTTMISTGTMPKTPTIMISTGTMPKTPTKMISTGTMPKTPTMMISTGTIPSTLTMMTTTEIILPTTSTIMKSTGTMPKTPIKMKSTGTMPKTPTTMKSIGTMSIIPKMKSIGTMHTIPTSQTMTTSSLISETSTTIELCCSSQSINKHS